MILNLKKRCFLLVLEKIGGGRWCRLWIEIEISENYITKGPNGPRIPNTGYNFTIKGGKPTPLGVGWIALNTIKK